MKKRMYLFAIPALLLFLVFWIIPVFQLFRWSFTDFNGVNLDYNFVGLKNYKTLFGEQVLGDSIQNTLLYTFLMALIGNLAALCFAILLNSKIRGKGFYRSALYIPTLFSAIVVGFIWSYVYMPEKGMIASLLSVFGFHNSELNILGNYKSALYGIIAVDIWKNIGTTIIIYLAGLQTVDESLMESGRIDGCSNWKLITKIQLPLIAYTITINLILNIISGLKAFDYSFIMTNGGPGKATNTLMFSIYKIAFTERMFGKAAAFSMIAFVLIIVITGLLLTYMKKREVEL